MLRGDKRIFTGNIKLIKADVVKEHIDPAKVVCRDIDFLSEETVDYRVSAKNLFSFEQKRTGTASRVVNLIDFGFTDRAETGKKLRNVSRGEELTARFAFFNLSAMGGLKR